MGKRVNQSLTMEDRTKQDYISQLRKYGIDQGPVGQSLQSMSYDEVLRFLSLKQVVFEE